ncbi:DUF1704 domain-containing protein [Candidatus Woesearchaeota archaeon]|nr:DUF1704 domain-containing protein [Candidatus Woesearchaeota archaeon]
MLALEKYKEVDTKLSAISSKLNMLFYLYPINADEQKDLFIKEGKDPVFRYRKLPYDLEQAIMVLKRMRMPLSTLGALYKKKRDHLIHEATILANRGRGSIVRMESSKIFGLPEDDVIDYAKRILRNYPEDAPEPKVLGATSVKEKMDAAFMKLGIKDWRIEFSDKWLTTVYPTRKIIGICRRKKFSRMDPIRLTVHEVCVHALRAENGSHQELPMFQSGLPGYLETEEGMAQFFEEYTKTQSTDTLRDYAARVLAVDAVYKGMSFRQTYDRLIAHRVNPEQAWNISVRTHRGGGLTRDHIYLQGYLKVKRWAKENGDFRLLYMGKMGLDDIPFAKEMLKKGILKLPPYIPKFAVRHMEKNPRIRPGQLKPYLESVRYRDRMYMRNRER